MHAAQIQYVELRKNREGRERAYVTGTRIRVQDIVTLHEKLGESAEEIATSHYSQLSLAQVHGALAYFFEDPEAIWEAIREDHAFAMEMKREQDARPAGQPDAQQPKVSS